MFVASVLSVRDATVPVSFSDGGRLGMRRRIYSVRVTESFAPVFAKGNVLDIQTGMGGGDCGYHFTIGGSYLIDAYAHDGTLYTGICSKTAPEAAAGALLHELRRLKAGERLPDLSGTVVHFPVGAHAQTTAPTPVPNVSVVLTGGDGTLLHAVTDMQGVYEVTTVPAGQYTVSFALPAGLDARLEDNKPQILTVPPSDGTGTACHLDQRVWTAGGLQGRVVDALGNGVPGFVAAFDHVPDCSAAHPWSAAGFTSADGTFNVGPLEAGTYWLTFQAKDNRARTWFYPGAQSSAAAIPLVVEDGKPTTGLHVQVSTP